MKQEINQCEEKFLQAFRTSNVNVVEELIHDELVYNNATGDVVSKKADIEGFKAANLQIETVDCVEREIQLFGDTAIVTTVIYLKASSGGHLIEGKTRFLRTWKKFNNGWKIIGVASVNLG
jgi:ketosteroid isomerase-like protein